MSETQTLIIPKVETLQAELEKRRSERLRGKMTQYPRKNPILSDLGDCDRQIVYGVTHWQAKPIANEDLQARYEIGHLMEREMIRELLGMGFEFEGGQDAVQITGRGGVLLATGRIDGFIKWQGERIPVEFKSMNPNIFDQVESIEDFDRKPWLRKYVRQLQMYMFGHNKEYGLFGLTNCLGKIKWLILYLDYGACEHLLQRLESVREHIEKGTLPERIDFSRGACDRCDFAQICLPDVMRTEAEILTEPSLIADLEEREKLRESASRYGELDKSIKKAVKGIKKGLAGSFIVAGKEMPGRHQEAYEVAPYWVTTIKRM